MGDATPDIVVVRDRISRDDLATLINIRPSQGNRSMQIEDAEVRARVRELTHQLLGHGEALP